jgi:deoxyribose-phosphate aldolase
MVIDLGAAMEDRWAKVTAEVAAVRAAIGRSVLLKAIIETALIGPDRIGPASHAVEAGGADFVKTSTGFHPAGGATVQAVAAIAAGATRIGTSHTAAILNGVHDE